MQQQQQLRPTSTNGHFSVVRLSNYWYAVARSASLRKRPLAVTLQGMPLVIFRSEGNAIGALLDRCPHRNVPLSLGQCQSQGTLRCAYHGWEFNRDGGCAKIPGRLSRIPERLGRVPSFSARDLGGLIWIYATPNVEPEPPLPRSAVLDGSRGHAALIREVSVEAPLHAALENALDVPHTAFLHGGLFRGKQSHRVTAKTSESRDRIVTEYLGEPRPSGLVARLLAPRGGVVEHWDRFLLPSIAEVEYRIGDRTHFLITAFCTPVSDYVTKMFAVVSFRTPIPGWLLRPVLERFAMCIFRQDAAILKHQTENIQRFGTERFVNTELDRMGPRIWRMLKRAEAEENTEPVTRNGGHCGSSGTLESPDYLVAAEESVDFEA